MSDTLERLRKVAPIQDHREFATVRVDLLTAAAADIQSLESKLNASQKALRAFVDAAKSWHEMHHPIGAAAVQCDWLCECIPAGEEALK